MLRRVWFRLGSRGRIATFTIATFSTAMSIPPAPPAARTARDPASLSSAARPYPASGVGGLEFALIGFELASRNRQTGPGVAVIVELSDRVPEQDDATAHARNLPRAANPCAGPAPGQRRARAFSPHS